MAEQGGETRCLRNVGTDEVTTANSDVRVQLSVVSGAGGR